ncbi:MAG: hypothetical protein K0U64_02890 [Actinomycetia bacterium]|nr:hypothetical protein [Actinomycetes bacterium]
MLAVIVVLVSVMAVVGCWAYFIRRNLPELLAIGGWGVTSPANVLGQHPLDDAPSELIDQLARSLRRQD